MSSVDQSHADSLEWYGKQILAWSRVRAQLEPTVLAFDKLDVSVTFNGESNLYVAAHGDKKRLADVIRVLRTNGWNTGTKPAEGSPEYRAVFNIEPTEDAPLAPSGSVQLSFTSSVCRRVRVGTQMVEQDIYEVRCGDDPVVADDDLPL